MAWSDQAKQEALDALRAEGALIGDVHKKTGIPKATLTRWAQMEGIPTVERRQVLEAQAVHRAQASLARSDRFDDYLASIQTKAGRLVETVVGTNAEWAEAVQASTAEDWEVKVNPVTGEEWVRPTRAELQLLRKRVLALRQMSVELPHAIGAFTRATHDRQLLAGRATENQAVQVVFSAGLAGPSAAEVAALDEGAVIVEGEVLE